MECPPTVTLIDNSGCCFCPSCSPLAITAFSRGFGRIFGVYLPRLILELQWGDPLFPGLGKFRAVTKSWKKWRKLGKVLKGIWRFFWRYLRNISPFYNNFQIFFDAPLRNEGKIYEVFYEIIFPLDFQDFYKNFSTGTLSERTWVMRLFYPCGDFSLKWVVSKRQKWPYLAG